MVYFRSDSGGSASWRRPNGTNRSSEKTKLLKIETKQTIFSAKKIESIFDKYKRRFSRF